VGPSGKLGVEPPTAGPSSGRGTTPVMVGTARGGCWWVAWWSRSSLHRPFIPALGLAHACGPVLAAQVFALVVHHPRWGPAVGNTRVIVVPGMETRGGWAPYRLVSQPELRRGRPSAVLSTSGHGSLVWRPGPTTAWRASRRSIPSWAVGAAEVTARGGRVVSWFDCVYPSDDQVVVTRWTFCFEPCIRWCRTTPR